MKKTKRFLLYLHSFALLNRSTKLLAAVLIIAFVFPLTLHAQITFERTYGGAGNDWSKSVQQTADGGYIIVGGTYSYGAGMCDVYLIKTDVNGDTLWTRTYGGMCRDWGSSVQQTTDGGYIIAGTIEFIGASSFDIYVIKTDAYGDTLWTYTYGNIYADYSHCVQQTTDGGYIIAGMIETPTTDWCQVCLIKIDTDGNDLWIRTYGGPYWEEGFSIQQTADSGYIVAGRTRYPVPGGWGNFYLIKTDANGDSLWTRTYGGTEIDDGYSVRQTADGGYIITGKTKSFVSDNYNDYSNVYLIKTDADGDTLWTRSYGSTSAADAGLSVQQTSDSGYVIAGWTQHSIYERMDDVYLTKTDTNGNILWTRTYGGTDVDEAHSIQQAADGGYIIAGNTCSFSSHSCDVYLIKTTANGLTCIEQKYLARGPDSYQLTQNFPNPFNSVTTILYSIPETANVELSIYNIRSRLVRSLICRMVPTGSHLARWDGLDSSGKEVSSGIYLCRLKADHFVQTKRMVLLR